MDTEPQERILKIIFTMFWQSVFSGVVIFAFLKVLNRLLDSTTSTDSWKFGAIDSILGGTLYYVIRYWFPPSINNAIKSKPIKKNDASK